MGDVFLASLRVALTWSFLLQFLVEMQSHALGHAEAGQILVELDGRKHFCRLLLLENADLEFEKLLPVLALLGLAFARFLRVQKLVELLFAFGGVFHADQRHGCVEQGEGLEPRPAAALL